jgi:hypothetical protein
MTTGRARSMLVASLQRPPPMMALTSSSEDRLEGAVQETLVSTPALATVLYVTSAILARPRNIDHYIDYFGDPVIQRR